MFLFRFANGCMTNGCGEEWMTDDKNDMASSCDGCGSSARQMTALRAAQAMFANAPLPPPTATGQHRQYTTLATGCLVSKLSYSKCRFVKRDYVTPLMR